MMIVNILKINLIFVVLFMFSCESLEDTYKDYLGDGKIKYVGKCKSFEIKAGWKRFVFEWKKSPDTNIKEIHIVWKSDLESGVYKIPATQNSFSTDATFKDSPYTFECYAVDKSGNKSAPIVQYARPYTETHELVIGFPRMVSKYFFVGNNQIGYDLVMFFDTYNEKVTKTIISYTKGGKQLELSVNKELFENKYYIIEDIDISKDIKVYREAEVEGSIDPIEFLPITLDRNFTNINFDFGQQLKDRYNLSEMTNDFIENLDVLELDYSLKSLEDVMYFPNLKKIVLGANRFTVGSSFTILSTLEEVDKSALALEKVCNKLGVEIIIHNNHYKIQDKLTTVTKKGNPTIPEFEFLDTQNWKITSSTNETPGETDIAHPELILDNTPTTLWAPLPVQGSVRSHELIINMNSEKNIKGFKVTQALLNNKVEQSFYPNIIHIQLSNDGSVWEEAMYQIQSTIGLNYGESTILYLPETKKASYIKIILVDKIKTRNNTCLGDFMVF